MPWEESGESWQVPAESDPRLPGEAARGKPSSAGPSECGAHTARPPPWGKLRPGEGRGGGGGGAAAPSPRSPSPAQRRLPAEAAAAASVALANSRGASLGLGPPRRLGSPRGSSPP